MIAFSSGFTLSAIAKICCRRFSSVQFKMPGVTEAKVAAPVIAAASKKSQLSFLETLWVNAAQSGSVLKKALFCGVRIIE